MRRRHSLHLKTPAELSPRRSPPGRVKLAKHKHTGQYAAVKIIPKPHVQRTRPEKSEKVRRESLAVHKGMHALTTRYDIRHRFCSGSRRRSSS